VRDFCNVHDDHFTPWITNNAAQSAIFVDAGDPLHQPVPQHSTPAVAAGDEQLWGVNRMKRPKPASRKVNVSP
jgi:hypothetical protein